MTTKATILVAFIGAIATIIAAVIMRPPSVPPPPQVHAEESREESGGTVVASSPEPSKGSVTSPEVSRPVLGATDLAVEGELRSQVEAMRQQFLAIESSLNKRMKDLGNLSPKPEVISAVGLCKSELAFAKEALGRHDTNAVRASIARIKPTLLYLQSL